MKTAISRGFQTCTVREYSTSTGKRTMSVLLVVVVLWSLAGCPSTAPQKRIVAFSEATNMATTNVAESFKAVERSYFDTEVSGLIAAYDPNKGFNVKAIKPLLAPECLKSRLIALSAVSIYAKLLGEIMSDEKLKKFDEETKSFGEVLKDFKENDAMNALNMSRVSLKDEDLAVFATFATAVKVIGHWIIEYKREKGVREIVEIMHPHIVKICKLLQQDIGATKGRGLRRQLSNQYEKLLRDRDSFIGNKYKEKEMSALELREELIRLANMVSQQAKADAALAASAQSLDKLQETHGKLIKAFNKEAPDLEALIRQLVAEAKRAKDFYDELN